jgi:hypothetical protein
MSVCLLRPIELLAKEGNHDAVKFLQEHFKANINHAVSGYAQAGFVNKVESLLARGASINEAGFGYAQAGLVDRVNDLLDRGALVNDVVEGYALAGLVDQVESFLPHRGEDLRLYDSEQKHRVNLVVEYYAQAGLINHVESMLQTRGASIHSAVKGYARAGLVGQVEDLLTRGALIECAIKGYAQAGLVDQVQVYMGMPVCIHIAANGYAEAGLVDQVESLLNRGAEFFSATLHYAEMGMVDRVDRLLVQNRFFYAAVYGYARAGLIEQIEDLLLRGADSSDVASAYMSNGSLKRKHDLLKILSFSHEPRNTQLYIGCAKLNYSLSFDIDAVEKQANRIQRIMREYLLDYYQAKTLGNQKENTWVWLLQGMQLTQKGLAAAVSLRVNQDNSTPSALPKLDALTYDHITSYLLEVPTEDAQKIRAAVNMRIFDSIVKVDQKRWKNREITGDEHQVNKANALTRFNTRNTF